MSLAIKQRSAPGKVGHPQFAFTKAAWAKRRAAVSMQIEKAALEVFVERGIDGVTVEEIAAAAGISRRTFYRYFETPDEVLTAVPYRSLARIWCAVQARPVEEHILDALLAALRERIVADDEVEMHALAEGVKRRAPDAYWRAMARMNPSATEIYSELFAERMRAAGQDPAPAGILASATISILNQASRDAECAGKVLTVDEIEDAFRVLINVMADSGLAQSQTQRRKK
jgi:AcrR family transcriptional regulator